MSSQIREDLSALMDGELTESESRFLIKRLQHDAELRDEWERLHALRGLMQSDVQPVDQGFAAGVADAIADEEFESVEQVYVQSNQGLRWLKPAAGMAVAALVGMVGFNYLDENMGADGLATQEAPAAAFASSPRVTASDDNPNFDAAPSLPQQAQVASGSVLTASSPWINPRLQSYVVRHSEFSRSRAGQGVLPYVYVVSSPIVADQDAESDPQAIEAAPILENQAARSVNESATGN